MAASDKVGSWALHQVTPRIGGKTLGGRILLFITLIGVVFVVAAFAWWHQEEQRAERVHEETYQTHARYIRRLVHASGERVEGWVNDYAAKPSAIRDPINAGALLDGVTQLWIFDRNHRLVNSWSAQGLAKASMTTVSGEAVRAQFDAAQRSARFFSGSPTALVEVFGAAIPAAGGKGIDAEPRGYILAARSWNDRFRQQLESLTSSRCVVVPSGARSDAWSEGRFVPMRLQNAQSETIAEAHFILDSIVHEIAQEGSRSSMNAFGAAILALMLSVAIGIVHFVSRPLAVAVRGFELADGKLLSELQKDPTEVGLLAKLAASSLVQQESIQRFSQDLQNLNQHLEERVRERTEALEKAYEATIVGWSRAMDSRDHETEGHTQRVATMAVELAKEMGRPESEIISIHRGALLHDIGKMGVPDSILLKPGALTSEEFEVMKRHPSLAYEMLTPIEFLGDAIDIPYCHHEKWDGSGYPRGLKGEDIPLSARIFAVADVWDALRSDRPYRRAWSEARVRAFIARESGTHFDPAVVEAFLKLPAMAHPSDGECDESTEEMMPPKAA